jgi:hypothetical protein
MRRLARVLVVGLALLLAPAGAHAAPGWVAPASTLSLPNNAVQPPEIASNARGDVAVVWLDPPSGFVFAAQRPAGGAFTMGTIVHDVTGEGDQALGSVAIDNAGNVYVFFITRQGTASAARPRVATKPLAGSTWTTVPLADASASSPPQPPMVGAVTPAGKGLAVWFRSNATPSSARLDFSTKAAGASEWAPKQELPGSPGVTNDLDLAMNADGEAALAVNHDACPGPSDQMSGMTMTAANVWTTLDAMSACTNNNNNLQGAPVIGIDANGTATGAWSRNNAPPMGTGNDQVQSTTKTLDAAVFTGVTNHSLPGEDGVGPVVAVTPDGTTTVAWRRANVLEERTRPAGGSFAGVTALPNTLPNPAELALEAGPDGSAVAVWTGTNPAGAIGIGAARRATAAGTFTSLPHAPGEDYFSPDVSIDDQGNAAVAWLQSSTGPVFVAQATGLDVAPPALTDVTFPDAATAGTSFPYGATVTDRWSTPTAAWDFGDSTDGPPSGEKAYAFPGSFVATLTAADPFGNSASVDHPIAVAPAAGPDATAPLISGLRANGRTLAYTLSEDAGVAFTLQRRAKGRRVGGKCRKQTRRNRKRKRCTRLVAAGGFAQNGSAGANQQPVPARLRGRRVRNGRYRVTLRATDAAGNRSQPARLNFRLGGR